MKTVASAAQAAQNWSSQMANPQTGAKYVAGIKRVTVSPTSQAASPTSLALYVANTQRAVNSGKMAAALNAVSLATWQNQAATLGQSGLARGAQKGASKVSAFFQRWQPIFQQASDAAQNLPKGGFANAQARWAAAVQVLMAAAGHA